MSGNRCFTQSPRRARRIRKAPCSSPCSFCVLPPFPPLSSIFSSPQRRSVRSDYAALAIPLYFLHLPSSLLLFLVSSSPLFLAPELPFPLPHHYRFRTCTINNRRRYNASNSAIDHHIYSVFEVLVDPIGIGDFFGPFAG